MSNTTIAGFHVIRASSDAPTPVYLGHGLWGRTWRAKPIIPTPFCSPFRHPIWWWKLRHLRRDTRLLESEVDPAVSRRMRELEDEAFLNGKGA